MKKLFLVPGILVVAAVVVYAVAVARNSAPAMPSTPMVASQPYLVKIHSRWSLASLVTKEIWPQLEEIYRGKVNFVVIDVSTSSSLADSADVFHRHGLDAVAQSYFDKPGTIVVADATRKLPRESVHGSRNIADYIAAVDAAFRAAAPAAPINLRPSLPSDTFIIP